MYVGSNCHACCVGGDAVLSVAVCRYGDQVERAAQRRAGHPDLECRRHSIARYSRTAASPAFRPGALDYLDRGPNLLT